jgi:hypothetical protein
MNVTARKGVCKAMKLSASQAAKAVGKSIPTVTRAIKSGKLSASKLESGGYEVEASELFRVWPAVSSVSDETHTVLGSETPFETSALRREVELLREMLDDAKADRDQWRDQAQKVAALIEDQRPRRGFWARLMG